MKRRRVLITVLFVALLTGTLQVDAILHTQDRLTSLYVVAFDTLMPRDEALNFEMEYIAVETGTLKGLDKEHAAQVLKHFEDTYGVPALDAGWRYLSSNPDLGTVSGLKGILLRASEVRFWIGRVAVLEVSKFRSGTGAIGSRFTGWSLGGKWRLIPTGGWIS